MSSTTAATVRPPVEPSGVIVNLTGRGAGREAGSPEGNLQGSVRRDGGAARGLAGMRCLLPRPGAQQARRCCRASSGELGAEGGRVRCRVLESREARLHLLDGGRRWAERCAPGGMTELLEVRVEELLVQDAGPHGYAAELALRQGRCLGVHVELTRRARLGEAEVRESLERATDLGVPADRRAEAEAASELSDVDGDAGSFPP